MFGSWDWIILVATLCFLIFAYGWRKNQFFKKIGINYLKPLPYVGNMLYVFIEKEHTVEVMSKVYNDYPNDKYAGLYSFMRPLVLIKDLDILKQIFVKDFDHFVDHMEFTDKDVDPYQGSSLFALTGDKWRQMRSSLSPAFTSSKMRGMMPFMIECTENVITHLKKEINEASLKGEKYAEFDTKDFSSRFSNDVIASCAFGIQVDSINEKKNKFFLLAKDFTQFTFTMIMKFLLYVFFPRLTKLFKVQLNKKSTTDFFHNLVMNNMHLRESQNIVREDMIHLLMLAKQDKLQDDANSSSDKNGNTKNKHKKINWTDEELIAQALVFIFAGFDTVSIAISFLLHELALNVEIQNKLYDEIKSHIKNKGNDISYADLNSLKYLDMVISETLRLWPPVIVLDRLCVKDFKLPPNNDVDRISHTIKKDDAVWIPVYNIHRDPKYFINPNKFDPERFSDENKSSIHPYTYMPFGSGPRVCIGSRFALMEMKIFITMILSNFEVVPTDKTPHEIKIKPHFFNLIPDGGFWIGFKKRNAQL